MFALLLLILNLFTITNAQTNLQDTVAQLNEQTFLIKDQLINSKIKGGERHIYKVKASAGQYFHLVVTSKDLDIRMMILDKDGNAFLEDDRGNLLIENKTIHVLAENEAEISIAITPFLNNVPAGDYQLKMDELRSATAQDRLNADAQKLLFIANQAYLKYTDESKKIAIEKLLQAEQLFQNARNYSEQIITLDKLASIYELTGAADKGITILERAISIAQAQGLRNQEADELNSLGNSFYALGNKDRALETLLKALTISKELNLVANQGAALSILGLVYDRNGDKGNALKCYQEALPLMRAAGNRTGENVVLINTGLYYYSMGEQNKAMEFYLQALSVAKDLNNNSIIAPLLNNIGTIYEGRGEIEKSLEYFQQSYESAKAINYVAIEATALTAMGRVHSSAGNKQKAFLYLEQALQVEKDLKNPATEGNTLLSIGGLQSSIGEHQQALETFNNSLKIAREINDTAMESSAIAFIGKAYFDLGDIEQSLVYYNQVLEITKKSNSRAREAYTLNLMALAYSEAGDKEKALQLYNTSLKLVRELNLPPNEASVLASLGKLYIDLKDYQKALEYFQLALPIVRKVGNHLGEAAIISNIGRCYAEMGDKKKGLAYYNQALPLMKACGYNTGEAITLYQSAIVERDLGNFEQASTNIKAAIEKIEFIRANVGSFDLRSSYFSTVKNFYEFYIDLNMLMSEQSPQNGYAAKALQLSEQARARVLLEMLLEAKVNIRQGADAQLLQREKDLKLLLNSKSERLAKLFTTNATNEQIKAAENEVKDLLTSFQLLEAEIRKNSPRYSELTQPQPLNLSEIQKSVVDNNTILLEYSLGKERSYLWAVTPTSLNSYKLPAAKSIEDAVLGLRRSMLLLKQGDKNETSEEKLLRLRRLSDYTKAALNVSKILLGPVADQLGNKRILLIADGCLNYLPFSALPMPINDNDKVTNNDAEALFQALKPLVLTNELVALPSATVLNALHRDRDNRKQAQKDIIVYADPVFSNKDERLQSARNKNSNNEKIVAINSRATTQDEILSELMIRSAGDVNSGGGGTIFPRLIYTRQEADGILALINGENKKSLDFDASRNNVNNEALNQYRILHFATHGLLNTNSPALSGLVLSTVDQDGNNQNGFLRANEILNLNLNADLVVLSACQTGLGKEVKGEGLIGLTRSFMYAGASRVMVSLWNLNDKAAAEFMILFYRKMLKDKLTPAAALRATQLEFRKQNQWQYPYYWAAFQLQGEW